MLDGMLIERTIRTEILGIGKKIRDARLSSGRPLTALAAEAGMSHTNWYRIEKEEVKAIPEETIRAIEVVLNINLIPSDAFIKEKQQVAET